MCLIIEIQLQEYTVNENEALKHLNVVPISKREVDLVRLYCTYMYIHVHLMHIIIYTCT